MRRNQYSAAELQGMADQWNRNIPEGTLISYEVVRGQGETHRGKTRMEATVLGGHSVVVWLEGKSGCVLIDHCTPVVEALQVDINNIKGERDELLRVVILLRDLAGERVSMTEQFALTDLIAKARGDV